MFSRSKFTGRSDNFKKRKFLRPWIRVNKNKKHHHHHDDHDHDDRYDGVMMSGDSSTHESRSLAHSGYDVPDEARPGQVPPVISLSSTEKPNTDSDTEGIEEVTKIVQKTLPSPEPGPKIEHNGVENGKLIDKRVDNIPDDDNCVKCIYVIQQCCDCVIV